jgi:ankyrin repeat protein
MISTLEYQGLEYPEPESDSESDLSPSYLPSVFGFTTKAKSKTKQNNDDIFVSIAKNNTERINELIKANPAIIYTEKNDTTPTNFSVQKGVISIPFRIQDGDTPLTFAIKYGRKEIIKLLFDNGVTVQDYYDNGILLLTRTLMGETENHINDLKSYLDVLTVLIKNGSDVNEVDQNGFSLLEKLLKQSSLNPSDQSILNKISWLLRMGADPNKCRKDGYTHLYHAIKHNKPHIIHVLFGSYEFDYKTRVILDKYGGIKIPTDVNKGSENTDINPVILAITSGYTDLVKFFFENGANVEYITSDADTKLGAGANFLHYACFYLQFEICEYLIENRFGVNNDFIFDVSKEVTSSGDTPIIIVTQNANSNSRSRTLIEILIGNGGDPDKKNKKGQTPISIAVKRADSALQSSNPESNFLESIVTILIEYEVDIQFSLLKSLKTNKIKTIISTRLLVLRQRTHPVFEKTKSRDIDSFIFPITDFITYMEYNSFDDCLEEIDEDDKDENGNVKNAKNNKVIIVNNRLYCINAKLFFDTYFSTRKIRYENQFYACNEMLEEFPDRSQVKLEKGSLFNLRRIGPFEGFVSYNLFHGLLKSNIKTFELIDSKENIPATTGIQMLHENRDAVSSAHCQEGTDGNLYTIKELRIKSNTPDSTPENVLAIKNKYKKTRNGGSRNGGSKKQMKQKYTRKSNRRRSAK